MSYALRHKPEEFGLVLDRAGWVSIRELASALSVSVAEIVAIAEADEKKRYTIQKSKIRAAQGHSFPVALGHPVVSPPEVLFHGTVGRFVDSIFTQGLLPGSRVSVHMSETLETAVMVGSRRGEAVILQIAAREAEAAGIEFQQAENGVWLAAAIPAKFITRMY